MSVIRGRLSWTWADSIISVTSTPVWQCLPWTNQRSNQSTISFDWQPQLQSRDDSQCPYETAWSRISQGNGTQGNAMHSAVRLQWFHFHLQEREDCTIFGENAKDRSSLSNGQGESATGSHKRLWNIHMYVHAAAICCCHDFLFALFVFSLSFWWFLGMTACALIPCGHYCVCVECASDRSIEECPICSSRADGCFKIITSNNAAV